MSAAAADRDVDVLRRIFPAAILLYASTIRVIGPGTRGEVMHDRLRKSFRCLAFVAAVVAISTGTGASAEPAPSPHKAFVLIEYQVRDQPLFAKLRDQVRASLKSYKGDLVTREKVAPIFGGNPTNLSVISFPTVQDARTWLASKELEAVASERDKAAKVSTYLVEKLN